MNKLKAGVTFFSSGPSAPGRPPANGPAIRRAEEAVRPEGAKAETERREARATTAKSMVQESPRRSLERAGSAGALKIFQHGGPADLGYLLGFQQSRESYHSTLLALYIFD